jgi:hypothetical protein
MIISGRGGKNYSATDAHHLLIESAAVFWLHAVA